MNRLELFGGAVITTATGPITGRATQRHRMALVALLSTTRRLYRSRDQLVGFLWPDADAERGRKLLSDSIYRINQALGGEALTGTAEDVRLNRAHVSSDVADFEAAVETQEWPRVIELYTGPFLDGFYLPGSVEFDQWMETERAQYGRTAAKAIEAVAVAARDAGRVSDAVDWWQRLAVLSPDDSRVAMELMHALEISGNRAGALRHAATHATFLRETLGVEPDGAVQKLADQIAGRRDVFSSPPVLSAPSAATPAPTPLRDISDVFFEARFQWHRRTEASLSRSATLFEQVVERDPEYARAWVGLADAYALRAFYDHLPPRVAFPRADCAARQAIRLDPRLAAPHATLAFVDTYYHLEWESAERGFRRAIELDPTYATAHQWYGAMLAAAGRFDEAEREMRRATELEPLSLIAHTAVGWALLLANDNDRAIRQFRCALRLDSNFQLTHYWLGVALDQNGRPQEAIPILQRVVELSNACPVVQAALAHAHAGAGNPATARALLDDLLEREKKGRYLSSYQVAKVHHALGDVPAALTRLERAKTDRAHSLALLAVDPQLQGLAGEPRFQALVVSRGLEVTELAAV